MISRIVKLFTNELVVASAIMLNSILLFIMGYEHLHNNEFLSLLDHAFTIYFLFEIVIKVGMRGWKYYWKNNWNKFDFFLVLISLPSIFVLVIDIPDISYLLVFRLLRVMRMLRFMRFIPNMSRMLSGIARAFKASVFVLVALVIYNVLLAVLASYLFREEAPEMFGDPAISLYSIFQVFTLEGWNDIPTTIIANIHDAPLKPVFTRIFFFFVVITGGIFGMSIMNAIFVDEMVMDNNEGIEDEIESLHKKIDLLMEEIRKRDQK
ncbi:ion transporter [Marinoscillum pacificum]|uniref:ion transporter n=1 Tax=Marinoscillum pacificum TaxID=392723 RepID=UPI0021579963|nr:ion transporter [Marinoscillum pacificum]